MIRYMDDIMLDNLNLAVRATAVMGHAAPHDEKAYHVTCGGLGRLYKIQSVIYLCFPGCRSHHYKF